MNALETKGVRVKFLASLFLQSFHWYISSRVTGRKKIVKMESQPNEILEHIFKQFPDLKSVTKCFNTNFRWRKIVEELFKNNGKKMKFVIWVQYFKKNKKSFFLFQQKY